MPQNANNARRFVIIYGQTTGIQTISDLQSRTTDAWYDLDGCKFPVRPTAPGLYIHNRKIQVQK